MDQLLAELEDFLDARLQVMLEYTRQRNLYDENEDGTLDVKRLLEDPDWPELAVFIRMAAPIPEEHLQLLRNTATETSHCFLDF